MRAKMERREMGLIFMLFCSTMAISSALQEILPTGQYSSLISPGNSRPIFLYGFLLQPHGLYHKFSLYVHVFWATKIPIESKSSKQQETITWYLVPNESLIYTYDPLKS